jgi:hypothetical protein
MVEVIPENGGPIRQHTNEPTFRDVWLHMSLGEAGQAQAHRTSRRSAWRSYSSPSTRTVLAGRRRYPSSIRDTEWCRTRERPIVSQPSESSLAVAFGERRRVVLEEPCPSRAVG